VKSGVVVHTCNPSNQEAEAEGSRVEASLGYNSEYQARLCYLVSKNKTKQKKPHTDRK
jgi:hypothetical protein